MKSCTLNGRTVTFSITRNKGEIDPTKLKHPGFSLSFIYNDTTYFCYGTSDEHWYHLIRLYGIHKGIAYTINEEQFMEDVMRDIIRTIDAAYELYGSKMHEKLAKDNRGEGLPWTYKQAIARMALTAMYFYSLGDVLSK